MGNKMILADARNEAEYNSLYGENEKMYVDAQQVNGQPEYMGEAAPYILVLTNTSGSDVSDLNFLDAAANFGSVNSGVVATITPSWGVAGFTYQQFLGLLMTRDIVTSGFYIESSTNAQALATILFTTVNGQGDGEVSAVIPKIQLNQFQSGFAWASKAVHINKFTKATLSKLGAGLTYTLNIYVSDREGSFGSHLQFSKPAVAGQSVAISPTTTLMLNK